MATCGFTEGEIAFGDIASRRLGLADIVFDKEDIGALAEEDLVPSVPQSRITFHFSQV